MVHPQLDPGVAPPAGPGGAEAWLSLEACARQAPARLLPWLAEPGLLTNRVRAQCGPSARPNLLRMEPAALDRAVAQRLGVDDPTCVLREIEFTCGVRRWVFAQSVFPESTLRTYPWLRGLGGQSLGESLAVVADVRREPLEFIALRDGHPLARAALGVEQVDGVLWARRTVYRLGGPPILVQEVFLPALGRCD